MKTNQLKAQSMFFEKFGQMINSAIPLHEALRIMQEETLDLSMKSHIKVMLETMTDKKPFYENMCKEYFQESTLVMIESGCNQGELDYVCQKISRCLEVDIMQRLNSSST
ncbi:MAG: type II secretion system F family protein [Candidatus Cloacimonetes bacterium]|nr:type II secretion system F family protein [Candidatus Cloacimonadota bacterium]